jgi:hypothetical protein
LFVAGCLGTTGAAFYESDALESMSTDPLSSLREQLTSILARKMEEEKTRLEERLRWLHINNGISPDLPRPSEISEPNKSSRDVVRPWKATALGAGAAQGRQKARAFSHCAILNRGASELHKPRGDFQKK